LGAVKQLHARAWATARRGAREKRLNFSRSFLRSENFWLQNRAILRNAARISLPLISSEKYAAQHPERLRKKPLLNYNQLLYLAALLAENQENDVQRLNRPLYCSAGDNGSLSSPLATQVLFGS
jgi:hypothetical protein